ncbi:MAG TPA: sigma-70 family RNA polymerase sigma factor [Terriglobales bacterium]|nr:sigma-70 family RNA polymerase sigma factor [Terriglobales bacterium]
MGFTGANGLSCLLFQAGPQRSSLGQFTLDANNVSRPQELLLSAGIKVLGIGFNLVWISGAGPQSDSFEDLAMPLFDQLYNFARWLTQNREEAEDLVQETYAKALKGFSSFQLGTNFRAWMYRILRNTFLTSRSGLRIALTVSLDPEEGGPDLAVEHETPETILMSRINSEVVQRAMEDLPVHYRETLLLCEVEEMSYQEIAETLSIPIGTVMSRLSRARDHLGRNLQGSKDLIEVGRGMNHGL